MKKVIIISAHPDDETLGAGGTILRHKKNGDDLYWLIATSMNESNSYSSEEKRIRKNEIEKVSRQYDFKKVFQLKFKPSELNSSCLKELITQISDVFNLINPNIVYNINASDIHSDHRILSKAVFSCTKSFRFPSITRVLTYECLSETEFSNESLGTPFSPNYFVDISDFIDKKIEIMKIYKSELGINPFPRSEDNIRALAKYRGSTINTNYAESFRIIKMINK